MSLRVGLAIGILFSAGVASACALVGEAAVKIAGEEALIVWDPAARREHFIRRAAFEGAPKDFGFLVPTPAKPELGEVDRPIFDRLFALYREPLRAPPHEGATRARAMTSAVPPPVTVVEQKTVAGLDATVLLATDPKALEAWLKAHAYPSSPQLTAWLAPYVQRGAYVTAFKISAAQGRASSGAVRMSFTTDAPYFPYAEPKQSTQPARPFRVSLIAPTKMSARLGKAKWAAQTAYAAPLSAEARAELLEGVVPEQKEAGWLTVFDEPASKRGDDDLTFEAAADARAVASRLRTRIAP